MPAQRPAKQFVAVGKRKTAIARIILKPGVGQILVNNREYIAYFGRETHRSIVQQPLETTGVTGRYDIAANIMGGGPAGQADALKYAIAKAILQTNPDYRKPLKSAGLLTRDSRIVERKKYGHRGARKRPQFSKR